MIKMEETVRAASLTHVKTVTVMRFWNMTKLCPMKQVPMYEGIKFGHCDGGLCGWWNYNLSECSIASIGAIGFVLMKASKTLEKYGESTIKE